MSFDVPPIPAIKALSGSHRNLIRTITFRKQWSRVSTYYTRPNVIGTVPDQTRPGHIQAGPIQHHTLRSPLGYDPCAGLQIKYLCSTSQHIGSKWLQGSHSNFPYAYYNANIPQLWHRGSEPARPFPTDVFLSPYSLLSSMYHYTAAPLPFLIHRTKAHPLPHMLAGYVDGGIFVYWLGLRKTQVSANAPGERAYP